MKTSKKTNKTKKTSLNKLQNDLDELNNLNSNVITAINTLGKGNLLYIKDFEKLRNKVDKLKQRVKEK